MTTYFSKISAKFTNFEVSSLGIEFQVLTSFWWSLGLGLEGYELDYITGIYKMQIQSKSIIKLKIRRI